MQASQTLDCSASKTQNSTLPIEPDCVEQQTAADDGPAAGLFDMAGVAHVQLNFTPNEIQFENLTNQMTNLGLVSALFVTMLFGADFARPWGEDVETYHEHNVWGLMFGRDQPSVTSNVIDLYVLLCFATCFVNMVCCIECVCFLLRLCELPRGSVSTFVKEYKYERICMVYTWNSMGLWMFLFVICFSISISCSPWVTFSFLSLIVMYMVRHHHPALPPCPTALPPCPTILHYCTANLS